MMLQMLKSKIQPATVTEADLQYEGSIGIDEDLLDAAGMREFEKVHVLNLSNGTRAETYIIKEKRGGGDIVMNGAIARLAQVGDKVIILSYGLYSEEELVSCRPKIILVDDRNTIYKIK
ncbi:aspartate 1-decarboxylase [bacterium]|nr:aspartate 1-decarboxylase [bacterium]